MRLHIHGARGSMPVSGPEFLRYGGYTTCFEVTASDGERIIVDCGSGLHHLEATLGNEAFDATVFLTHFHWDHIQGLPFFGPIFDARTRLRVIAAPPEGLSVAQALEQAIRPPWFPVAFADFAAHVTGEPLPEGPLQLGTVEVRSAPLPHPGGVVGYRFSEGGRSLVIATDTEVGDGRGQAALGELAAGASVLVCDAQYTPDEHASTRRGWGHSTWAFAAQTAVDAGVERLVLTSHDPHRTDAEIDAIVERVRAVFPNTIGAHEGQILEM